jgi:hypothetical protein
LTGKNWLSRRDPRLASSLVTLYVGALVLLGGWGPMGDATPSEPSPSGARTTLQRVGQSLLPSTELTPCDVLAWVEEVAPTQMELGFARSLVAKAEGACQSWRQGNAEATRSKLRALLNDVKAHRGKYLSESAADTLAAALGAML